MTLHADLEPQKIESNRLNQLALLITLEKSDFNPHDRALNFESMTFSNGTSTSVLNFELVRGRLSEERYQLNARFDDVDEDSYKARNMIFSGADFTAHVELTNHDIPEESQRVMRAISSCVLVQQPDDINFEHTIVVLVTYS